MSDLSDDVLVLSLQLRNWGIRWTGDIVDTISTHLWLMGFLVSFFKEKMKPYKTLLSTSPDVTPSGILCYYGSCLLSFVQWGEVRNPHLILKFTTLYLLVDYYLDSKEISSGRKKSLTDEIGSFFGGEIGGDEERRDRDSTETKIERREKPPLNEKINTVSLSSDPFSQFLLVKSDDQHEEGNRGDREFIDGVLKIMKEIAEESPQSIPHFYKLFQVEVESVKVQSSPPRSRDEYLISSEKKGMYTTAVIQSLLGGEITEDILNLGAIIQLIDDIIDIDEDREESINTIATHDKELDKLICHISGMICGLSASYSYVKVLLYQLLLYGVTKHKSKLSSQVLLVAMPYLFPSEFMKISSYMKNGGRAGEI